MSFLVIGLLLMSIVAMSGCADNKTSNTTAPAEENTEENAGNLSANNTMPPENPGQMPPENASMPPEGAPNMSANGSMPPAPGNMSIPPEGAPQAGNESNMS